MASFLFAQSQLPTPNSQLATVIYKHTLLRHHPRTTHQSTQLYRFRDLCISASHISSLHCILPSTTPYPGSPACSDASSQLPAQATRLPILANTTYIVQQSALAFISPSPLRQQVTLGRLGRDPAWPARLHRRPLRLSLFATRPCRTRADRLCTTSSPPFFFTNPVKTTRNNSDKIILD